MLRRLVAVASLGLMEQVLRGKPPGDLTCDDILDNIMLYWAERVYPNNLTHYHKLDRGGDFAAWDSRSSSRKR